MAAPHVTGVIARLLSRQHFLTCAELKDLLVDLIPFIEKTYSVKSDRESRALAGLSMGGGQTTGVLIKHPDQFAYFAIWSAGLFGGKGCDPVVTTARPVRPL